MPLANPLVRGFQGAHAPWPAEHVSETRWGGRGPDFPLTAP